MRMNCCQHRSQLCAVESVTANELSSFEMGRRLWWRWRWRTLNSVEVFAQLLVDRVFTWVYQIYWNLFLRVDYEADWVLYYVLMLHRDEKQFNNEHSQNDKRVFDVMKVINSHCEGSLVWCQEIILLNIYGNYLNRYVPRCNIRYRIILLKSSDMINSQTA